MTDLVVLKFGGTSVKDAAAMRRVATIVADSDARQRLVITSACSGMTDRLVALTAAIDDRESEQADRLLQEIESHHDRVATELGSSKSPPHQELIDELGKLCSGLRLLDEVTPRSRDLILSFGERLSSTLLLVALREVGLSSELVDARDFLITDSRYGQAEPLFGEIVRRTTEGMLPRFSSVDVLLTQGFIGATEGGETTTIGRGGSDHTAALLGAALCADRVEIWTDVDGILTADPRVVAEARPVPMISFAEARELAKFGAKVLHPDTILPAVRQGVPVVIRNTGRPQQPGTTVVPDDAPGLSGGIHALTSRRELLAVYATPDAQDREVDVASALHAVMHSSSIQVHASLTADRRGVALIDRADWNERVASACRASGLSVECEETAVLCLVGSELKVGHGTLLQPLEALSDVPLGLVMAGTSEHLVLLQVPVERLDEALQAVHKALFGSVPTGTTQRG